MEHSHDVARASVSRSLAEPSDPAQHSAVRLAYERWRQQVIRQVYIAGIQVFAAAPQLLGDPQVGAIEVLFVSCKMENEADVAIAFDVLDQKVQQVLAQMRRSRAALLVNIAGMTPTNDIQQVWGRELKQFLGARCEFADRRHERFLNARYALPPLADSVSPDQASPGKSLEEYMREVAVHIASVLEHMSSNVYTSREEALAHLRLAIVEQRRYGMSWPSAPASSSQYPFET